MVGARALSSKGSLGSSMGMVFLWVADGAVCPNELGASAATVVAPAVTRNERRASFMEAILGQGRRSTQPGLGLRLSPAPQEKSGAQENRQRCDPEPEPQARRLVGHHHVVPSALEPDLAMAGGGTEDRPIRAVHGRPPSRCCGIE